MDDPIVTLKFQELSNRISSIEQILASTQANHLPSQHFTENPQELTNIKDLAKSIQEISGRLFLLEESLSLPHTKSYLKHVIPNLSLPGLKFIGRSGLHVSHTLLWSFIHITALFISCVYITEEYANWQTSPVIRTLSNNLTFIEEIPFPAVTICIPNALSGDFDYVETVKKCIICDTTFESKRCIFNGSCDSEEAAILAVASLICENTVNAKEPPWMVFARDKSKTIESLRFSNLLKKVFPPCDVNITQFKLIDDETISGCDENRFEHFVVVNSKYAMCTTINGLRHEDIYRESTVLPIPLKSQRVYKGYKGDSFTLENMFSFAGYNTTPLYGDFDDLVTYFVTKRENSKKVNTCNYLSANKIAYVILHNPAEIPLMQDYFHGHVIQEDEFNALNIIPELVTTEKELISFKPKERGCFYSHERQLSLFKNYNANNCEIECYVNCTLRKCGCVPSFFPTQNTSTKVCMSKCPDYDCDCGCLPDCVSLSYKFEVNTVQANLSGKGHVQIGFKSKSVYSTIRASINSFAQFLAFSLGILGVCNGFSVMVILEFLYLLTFGLWHSITLYFTNSQ